MNSTSLVLNELVKNSLKNNADKKALHVNGSSFTYKELHKDANRTAQALKKSGIVQQSRVALLLPNCYEYVVSELAIYYLGATKIALNSMVSESDILYILEDADAELLIVDNRFLPMIEKIKLELPKLQTIIVLGAEKAGFEEWISWDDFRKDCTDEEVSVKSHHRIILLLVYGWKPQASQKGSFILMKPLA